MCEFLTSLGRKVAVVNLDPANDSLSYNCAVDISTLITLNDVMENLKLGPNGGLIYCIEYLEKNIDWLEKKLKEMKGYYFLFDCPGQVELYTHHASVRNVVRQLEKWDFRVSETGRVQTLTLLFQETVSLYSLLNGVPPPLPPPLHFTLESEKRIKALFFFFLELLPDLVVRSH